MSRPVRRPLLSRVTPPQLIALSFALAILIGGALLSLPGMVRPGQALGPLDALFMATSALCVTGLSVVDLPRTLTLTGQCVLLLLIQLGGLGIVTLGTLFALLARRRIAFSQRVLLAQQISALNVGGVLGLLRSILLYTAVIEASGTALLALRFVPEFGWGQGLYYSVYHAVMAFNNAGFTLLPQGLTPYVADPLVSVVVPVLVILGGTGFLVQANILGHLRDRRRQHLLVHSRIVLSVMAVLLVGGTALFALLEWSNPRTLGPLGVGAKVLASFFHSVSPRTAGFNTLDYELMRPATLFLTILLMFIGANPGSTGGGIKTSTAFVMLGSAWNMVRGRGELIAFRRRLDQETVLRALSVTLLSTVIVGVALMLMLALNSDPRLDFLHLTFETVSAFATAGLSMNATPDTNAAQRVLLLLLMYVGRIGPLTFAVAFNSSVRVRDVNYPPERDILVG
ncbi:TrkH family potassium uptake protein [Deinococcus aquiradiocola]|uniref:TrkH family potassium uptake protein n=1 Tax=Deinococcus aquiradiocola TaxID=393059 RepID=UPI00166D24F5|nr:TrkH family potassium uptake protein [Deinococcus aquiradiocola]